MKVDKIGSFQMFSLIVLFELGTALLLEVGKNAGKDAWISMLMGLIGGLFLFTVYLSLFKKFQGMMLTQYVNLLVGKRIGRLISFIYIIYFIYIAGRNLRDFSDLLIVSEYSNAPLYFIALPIVICSMYAIFQGLRSLGRIAEISLILIAISLATLFIAKVISKLIVLDNLLPIAGNGWERILNEVFPTIVTFPFGEMIAFTMLLPYLSKRESAGKIGFIAIICSGLYLSFTLALHVSILGESIFIRSQFPFLTSVSLINIADFITRLDIFIIILMVLLGFFKMTIFFFCAVLGLSDLFKIKDMTKFSIPIGSLIFVISIAMASSYTEHIQQGLEVVPYYLHIPLQIVIPTILLCLSFLRRNSLKNYISRT
ncbi:GerAB/ArcD/ProY family transporter [Fictibacillus sp. 18YEL24]|uniref:GerAB/ArcD/ProY family transporter n=1 Tax=Fictibacillus sp. 18YEL24 TaxID=2745875 RepID=UPI0018CF4815|nr:endospore germination permease [Fictibacillus sp. 18YEL24]MBH0171473.1 endospore germination permease [Fictibacillus sp. 18YEL24]